MSIFSQTGGLKPSRSVFNLSHTNLFDTKFGDLVPAFFMECVPGDVFKMSSDVVARLASTLQVPVLTPMDIVFEAFFCPTRLLMGSDANFETPIGEGNFETFLTGGRTGNETVSLPVVNYKDKASTGSFEKKAVPQGGISDFIGIQIGANISDYDLPLAFPWRAYRFIWNNYYRNENFTEEIQVCQFIGDGSSSDETYIPISDYDKVLKRGWKADYFTSALPDQQRGISPAFTIEGQLPVQYNAPSTVPITYDLSASHYDDSDSFYNPVKVSQPNANFPGATVTGTNGTSKLVVPPFNGVFTTANKNNSNDVISITGNPVTLYGRYENPALTGSVTFVDSETSTNNINIKSGGTSLSDGLKANASGRVVVDASGGYVDLQNAITFDIKDIRQGFQIQKWLERNMRCGYRYTEYLQGHFGVSPSDARLQRPEFIGAFRQPWIIQEVVQTSSSENSTPQGTQAGQAVSFGHGKLGTYHIKEFGYIIVMVSIVPKPQYQDGIPRSLSRKSKYDFYSPEFAHLSEQAIMNKELFYANGQSGEAGDLNNSVFGYTGIFNELRFLPSRVSNHMRSSSIGYTYDMWHLARHFEETPVLNSDWLTIGGDAGNGQGLMRIFSVQDENPFIIHAGLNVKAVRPLPRLAEPGLVDHF